MLIFKVFVLVFTTYVAADDILKEAREVLQVHELAPSSLAPEIHSEPTKKPTSIAPQPPTTTPKPSPTPSTTPKPPPTPSTTPKPSPTTTPPSPTTPPTPVDPPVGFWSSNYTSSNKTCIILQIAAQLNIEYKEGNKTKTIKVNVPKNATSEGNCPINSNEENIKLTWNTSLNTNNIIFYFAKVNKTKFDMERIEINANLTIPGINGTLFKFEHLKNEFTTPLLNSYKCMPEKRLNLTFSNPINATAYLGISQLQFEAFKNSTGQHFNYALDCSTSNTPDAVPIAVGCALAALVIIVLAAYLIGRRRSQARGYLSM